MFTQQSLKKVVVGLLFTYLVDISTFVLSSKSLSLLQDHHSNRYSWGINASKEWALIHFLGCVFPQIVAFIRWKYEPALQNAWARCYYTGIRRCIFGMAFGVWPISIIFLFRPCLLKKHNKSLASIWVWPHTWLPFFDRQSYSMFCLATFNCFPRWRLSKYRTVLIYGQSPRILFGLHLIAILFSTLHVISNCSK